MPGPISIITLTEDDLVDADFDITKMTPSQFSELVRELRQYYLVTFLDNLSDFAEKNGIPKIS